MNITISEKNGTVIGVLDGRLDTAAAPQFAKDMEPLMEKANLPIVLDCTKLEYVSSSGLRLFLTLRKKTIAEGGSVTIKGVNAEIKQVFTITGFISLFNFE